MKKEIKLKPIGIINTPYKEPKGIPIRGKFKRGVTGTARIFPGYKAGLKDIEGFSHVILIYYFDKSKKEELLGKPFLEDGTDLPLKVVPLLKREPDIILLREKAVCSLMSCAA